MPLGTEVGLGPGDIELVGDPAHMERGTAAPPHFSAHVYCGQTVAHLNDCWALVNIEVARFVLKKIVTRCTLGPPLFLRSSCRLLSICRWFVQRLNSSRPRQKSSYSADGGTIHHRLSRELCWSCCSMRIVMGKSMNLSIVKTFISP